jgi:translation initiation factor IF-2
MVQRELARNVQVGNDVLLAKASEIDRGVRRLSPRQFHATYRLPALRLVNAAAGAKAAAAAAPARASTSGAKPGAAKPGAAKSAAKSASPDAAATRAPQPAAPAPSEPRAEARAAQPKPEAPSHLPASQPAASHAPSSSKALARPHAAEREAVRAILQLVAREALTTEDRASFVRLLDSLDERAAVILGLFGRA